MLTGAAQLVPVAVAFVLTVLPAFRDVTVSEAVPNPSGGAVGRAAAVAAQGALVGIDHRAGGRVLLAPVTAAAMVTAGLLSVLVFPTIALGLLRDRTEAPTGDTQPRLPEARREPQPLLSLPNRSRTNRSLPTRGFVGDRAHESRCNADLGDFLSVRAPEAPRFLLVLEASVW